ncbi:MAG: hypothetical protein ACK5LJ_06150 [Paracoccus sp. (in: a-proteobacteria)]
MKTVIWTTTLAVLGVAACTNGDGRVTDPRMRLNENRGYQQYQLSREAALTGKAAIPQVVPMARPYIAPNAAQIEGKEAMPASANARPGQPAAQKSGKGGYYNPETGERLASNPAPAAVVAAPVTVQGVAAVTAAAEDLQPVAQSVETDALARYASAQNHAVGSAVYKRIGASANAAAQGCARYPNPNAAQLMFLSSGGPQQDPMGIDPDGDGFVCGWTPTSYQGGGL